MPHARRVAQFIREHCYQIPGLRCLFGDFVAAFVAWLPAAERDDWGKADVGAALDAIGIPRGIGAGGQVTLGNIDLRSARPVYRLHGRRLLKERL